jgi:teichuronic acid biosynthesis glycosyltransferase TuaG
LSKQPKVSVIIPCFNAADYIERTLLSAVRQDVHKEILCVDDASTDDTAKVIIDFAKRFPEVRLIQLPENSGPAHARNVAIGASAGEFIAFLDSDDFWLPGKLVTQVQWMESFGGEYSFHDYISGRVVGGRFVLEERVHAPKFAKFPQFCFRRGYGMCLTSLFKRSVFERARFPEDRSISCEDYYLFLSLLLGGVSGVRVPECSAVYVRPAASRSSNKLKQAKSVLRTNISLIGHPWAIPLFLSYAIFSFFAIICKFIIKIFYKFSTIRNKYEFYDTEFINKLISPKNSI